ncbi:hypothetical protein DL95DRAFT_196183 [Leptodontidium sp. 2 PMI_412]|nr:hypothetical protein BKA61DRAFT_610482 [Leptodontidium sp. MPI-SDFR-AT-0119]KAH9210784.1 hypothetical protein DL95DRAFT_196183 [Leptodontidium sp. 2 PMI_412]
MSNLTYNYNTDEVSSFDYNDEPWQTGTSSSSSDVYTPVDQSDAMARWTTSCHSIIPFDYEAWQVERTFPESDMYCREDWSSVPLSVWEASAQGIGNTMSRAAQTVPGEPKTELSYSQSPSCDPSSADSPPDTTSTSRSRKHLSESALNRRRSQNRESQRSFRERQKLHVQWLEEQVRGLKTKHHELEKEYIHLDGKYRALLGRTTVKEETYQSTDGMGSWSSGLGLDSVSEHP